MYGIQENKSPSAKPIRKEERQVQIMSGVPFLRKPQSSEERLEQISEIENAAPTKEAEAFTLADRKKILQQKPFAQQREDTGKEIGNILHSFSKDLTKFTYTDQQPLVERNNKLQQFLDRTDIDQDVVQKNLEQLSLNFASNKYKYSHVSEGYDIIEMLSKEAINQLDKPENKQDGIIANALMHFQAVRGELENVERKPENAYVFTLLKAENEKDNIKNLLKILEDIDIQNSDELKKPLKDFLTKGKDFIRNLKTYLGFHTDAEYKKDSAEMSRNLTRTALQDFTNLGDGLQNLAIKNKEDLLYKNMEAIGDHMRDLLKILPAELNTSKGTLEELLNFHDQNLPKNIEDFNEKFMQRLNDIGIKTDMGVSSKGKEPIGSVPQNINGEASTSQNMGNIENSAEQQEKDRWIASAMPHKVIQNMSQGGGGAISPSALPEPSTPSSPKSNKSDKKKEDDAVPKDGIVEQLGKYLRPPSDLLRPYDTTLEATRPAPFDDKYLREVQKLWDWADYASKLSQKMEATEKLGQHLEDIITHSVKRPDPEKVALIKRYKRLADLNDIMSQVPKVNKLTAGIEQTANATQHQYLKGLNNIFTGQLKNQLQLEHNKASMGKLMTSGLGNIAKKHFETQLEIGQTYEKMMHALLQMEQMRSQNTWQRIKGLINGFRW